MTSIRPQCLTVAILRTHPRFSIHGLHHVALFRSFARVAYSLLSGVQAAIGNNALAANLLQAAFEEVGQCIVRQCALLDDRTGASSPGRYELSNIRLRDLGRWTAFQQPQ